jgi:virginiamycin B lyase
MKPLSKSFGLVIGLALAVFDASAGTISGTVTDPSGKPFRGAFVQAQNAKTKITTHVLSDQQGRYRVESLPPGEYEIRAKATGYKSDPRRGVKVADGSPASLDFKLQTDLVRWSDLSLYQAWELLPAGRGKELLQRQCSACHGLQTRMAATRRDAAGWTQAINYMRESEKPRLGTRVNDQDAADLVSYLTKMFGPDSILPRSPAELPKYKETLRSFGDEATKIVYVEYEMPGPNRHPFSAAPDKDGYLWLPYFGKANAIGRLDPKTGAIEEFPAPHQGTAGIHTAVPAPDGSVWIGEQASNKVGKWDPVTRKVTEYQDRYKPGLEGFEDGGSKHTVRIDHAGKVWGTAVGSILTAFDPRTREFSHYPDVLSPYGVVIDADDNPWFAEFSTTGKFGKVDQKTGKVYKWAPLTPGGWPRRIEIDSKGIVWVALYRGGKLLRFDPKTEAIKEFTLPGPKATPYALGIDRDDYIWYSSDEMDTVGRLDPNTGQVIEFPYPYSENMMKEFFLDSQGRMWYGSPPNNRVGYFTYQSGSRTR